MKTRKVRNIKLGRGRTKICVPVSGSSKEEIKTGAAALRDVPSDLAEWRADSFSAVKNHKMVLRCLEILRDIIGDKPLLFTYRTAAEGGTGTLSGKEYYELNRAVCKSGLCDMVDLELSSGTEPLIRKEIALLKATDVTLVGSFHDFQGTPEKENITDKLCKMQELGFDVCKAAVMPKTERDVLTLIDAGLEMKHTLADRPYVAISMGRLGAVTRGAAGFIGSAFTFGTAAQGSAPGQFSSRDLKKVLELFEV